MSKTQILTRDAFGVTYANPTDPDFRVRFKTTSSQKSLNGVSVMNFVTEIIVNDNVPVTLGNTSANDPVAVRIRVFRFISLCCPPRCNSEKYCSTAWHLD